MKRPDKQPRRCLSLGLTIARPEEYVNEDTKEGQAPKSSKEKAYIYIYIYNLPDQVSFTFGHEGVTEATAEEVIAIRQVGFAPEMGGLGALLGVMEGVWGHGHLGRFGRARGCRCGRSEHLIGSRGGDLDSRYMRLTFGHGDDSLVLVLVLGRVIGQ